jgi:hypothetical protein
LKSHMDPKQKNRHFRLVSASTTDEDIWPAVQRCRCVLPVCLVLHHQI